ncbi:MAG: DUF1489 domain-containing protein [Paracoccaceae bacterium]|nr:DUF1489 domain-containing protein [Paracoccaceae bacterium]
MTHRHVNLVKLCVGIRNPNQLRYWQNRRRAEAEANGTFWRPSHVTRSRPRRLTEVLAGGSLYWVIDGEIRVRQAILALEPCMGQDGIRRCRIVMDPQLIDTVPVPRSPFQGWRYLEAKDSPRDIETGSGGDGDRLTPEIARALDEIGLR